MVSGFAIYQPEASKERCVVEIPDNWTRTEVLPLQSLSDRGFDTLAEAQVELTRRLDGLSGKRT